MRIPVLVVVAWGLALEDAVGAEGDGAAPARTRATSPGGPPGARAPPGAPGAPGGAAGYLQGVLHDPAPGRRARQRLPRYDKTADGAKLELRQLLTVPGARWRTTSWCRSTRPSSR